MNPFLFYPAEEDTLEGERGITAILRSLGLDAPELPSWDRGWLRWWDLHRPSLSEQQVAAVWAVFKARPLFELVEVPLED